MHTIVIGNHKGGVGKTTAVVNIAHELAESGKRVAVLDLDTQGSASRALGTWNTSRSSAQLINEGLAGWNWLGPHHIQVFPAVFAELVQLADTIEVQTIAQKLEQGLEELEQHDVDFCLLDTAPTINRLWAAAIAATANRQGHAIVPTEIEADSLVGLTSFVSIMEKMTGKSKALNLLGVLPSRVENRRAVHQQNLAQFQQVRKDTFPPALVHDAVSRAIAEGIPLSAVPSREGGARAARDEWRAIREEVLKRINAQEKGTRKSPRTTRKTASISRTRHVQQARS